MRDPRDHARDFPRRRRSRLSPRRRAAAGARTGRSRRPAIELLECRQMLAADALSITEFMASNGGTLLDQDGASSDWIEVHNAAAAPQSLDGWFLTDDAGDLEKWEFPAVVLEPDEYVVVFASKKDRADAAGELHTNFKLSSSGEYVALVAPGGAVVSEFGPGGADYPEQFRDISYGATPVGARYFAEPTPGAANADGYLDFVSETSVSTERGFYDEPFQLQITNGTEGATIRYTTDGTRPTETSGSVYTEPILISSTTILRTAAFKEDFAPSAVETHTYIFPDDVLQQSEAFGKDGTGLAPFVPWGHSGKNGDWDLDPDIVNHPLPENRFTTDDLKAVPTISVVLPWDDMFGADGQGIYLDGKSVPRGASIEQILEDGSTGFQSDASVQIQGNSSTNRWKVDKLSMRVKFTAEFGPTKLEYPLFGDDAAQRFDTFILDAVDNYGWLHRRQSVAAKYIQDQYVANLHNAMGGTSPHGRYNHLYINGIYWGMYYVHERADASFAAEYFGGDKDDYDVIKHDPIRSTNENPENYLAMVDLAREDLTVDANYQNLAAVLDIPGLADYMIANFYVGNIDWGSDNWYATFNRVSPDGKWRFHSWDAEEVLTDVNESGTVSKNNPRRPTEIHQLLTANAEYRLLFADRLQKHYFNGGVLTPEKAAAEYQKLMDEVDRAIVGESARWGDNRRDDPFTRQDWLDTQEGLLENYFPLRTGISLNQFRPLGLFPDIESPSFNQHGGTVSESFDITLSAPEGTIYYTIDGSDPRLPGGDLSPRAIPFREPFRLPRAGVVKVRAARGEGEGREWSALNEAAFTVTADLPLRITEINYQPHDANPVPGLGEQTVDTRQFEFLELANAGSEAVDLAGVRLVETSVGGDRQGVRFTFAAQMLPPGERLVVVSNRAAFQSRYGDTVAIAAGSDGAGGAEGEFGGQLDNDGEQITLVGGGDAVIAQFDYGVGAGWPERAAGRGSSLEVIDLEGDYDDPANWRASGEFGGSPGQAGEQIEPPVVINEVLANPQPGQEDRIELRNTTAAAIDVGNWYVSNTSEDYFRYQITLPTDIPGGGYRELTQAQFGFDLNGAQGDSLWLIEAAAAGRPLRFVDTVAFDASDAGVALGRWPDGAAAAGLAPMTAPSLGQPNPGPRAGNVVISEIYYNAPLPLLQEDFDEGTAEAFRPEFGTWNVTDGRYEVMPGPERDTVSLLPGVAPLAEQSISATVRIPSDTGTFKKNAAIIFDYQSATDFKFVSIHVKNDRWRIGQRDESGWKFLADELRAPFLEVDTDVQITVEIRGATVTVWSDGVLKVRHTFAEPLGGGQIGLGSKNGQATFDNVTVRSLRDPEELEFVELFNAGQAPVDLTGWQLAGAAQIDLAGAADLGPGEALVVVGFDPSFDLLADDFRRVHDVAAAVPLVGPYAAGGLAGGDGTVTLRRPVAGAGAAGGLVLVDQAGYDDQPPWPAAAAGESLQRTAPAAFGPFAASWLADQPTPGSVDFALQAGDLNGDGRVDTDDIDPLVLALRDRAQYEAIYGRSAVLAGDTDGDGDLDFDDIQGFLALLQGGATAAATASAGSQPLPAAAAARIKGPIVDEAEHRWDRLADEALERETVWRS